jgi:hypothetical protein
LCVLFEVFLQDGSIVVWSFAGDKPSVRSFFSLVAPDPAKPPANSSAAAGSQIVEVPNLMAKQIQSLCISPGSGPGNSDLLLVSTRGCDLLELCVSATGAKLNDQCGLDGGILVRGHCNDELWGLSTHPRLPEFCTVGKLFLVLLLRVFVVINSLHA